MPLQHIWPDEFWPIWVLSSPSEVERNIEIPDDVRERYEASLRAMAASQVEIAKLLEPHDGEDRPALLDIANQLQEWAELE